MLENLIKLWRNTILCQAVLSLVFSLINIMKWEHMMCVLFLFFFCFVIFDRLLVAKCLKIKFKIASLLSCLFVILLILDHEVKLQFYGHYRKMLKDQNGLNSNCISWL